MGCGNFGAPRMPPLTGSIIPATWLAARGDAVDAIRHAQTAEDWPYVIRLLGDYAIRLLLKGQDATVGALLNALPEDAASDPLLDLVFACYHLVRGSLDDAAAYIALAERHATEVPADRRHRFEMLLAARIGVAVRPGLRLRERLDSLPPVLVLDA